MTALATPSRQESPRTLVELNEWQRRGPREDNRLTGLSVADNELIERELDALRSKVDVRQVYKGIEIRTTSFVGQLELGPVTLQIRPKIPAMPLAWLLRYAYGLREVSLQGIVQAPLAAYGFHDVLIAMLTAEVRELLSRGLSRTYVPMQRRLATPRGELLLPEIARRGGITEAALDCRYHERSADWLLNQVLRAGLTCAMRMTTDRFLLHEIRRLSDQFDTVRMKSELPERDLTLVERGLTRLTEANRPALAIVRLLRDMMGFDFENPARSGHIRGFLFDMNSFFQRLLLRFLTEHVTSGTIADERQIKDVLSYLPDANPRRRSSPKPRPDYALVRRNRVELFLDAKYRDVWRLNVHESWLYQLAVYALASQRRVSIMLYPSLDSDARDERLAVWPAAGSSSAATGTVVLRPVPLMRLAELLDAKSSRALAARRQLAEQLVDAPV
jgi:5-methylcytosine-specific restriction enzyme subunit McrC